MERQIFFDDDARKSLREGANKAADAIGDTMGPAGRTVIIYEKSKFLKDGQVAPPKIRVTKDGITVAASISLKNEVENIGAQMIRNASETTYFDAGDGTTQTAVLAQSIINEGIKQVAAGANPMEVKIGIDKGVAAICKRLKELSIDIGDDNDKIRDIATTSANNDTEIGGYIADAYKKIGKNGLLMIENSSTIHTSIEVIEGYEMPRGYISPDFATDEKKRAVHKNALILVADYDITIMKEIIPLLNMMKNANMLSHPLIIIAQDYQGEFYSSMLMNHRDGTLRNCLVKAPGAYRKEHLEDIATMTGATVIRDEDGLKMISANLTHLGSAEKVIISEYTTTIVGGGGTATESKKKKVEDLKNTITVQLEEMKDEQLKPVWEKRLAKICGSIAVIKVGSQTDVEQKEKIDRVDDACRAVKAAIEEGVVTGGGSSLIKCTYENEIKASGDESVGIKIVIGACFAPLERMLLNAGMDKALAGDIRIRDEENVGWNLKTRKFGDLVSQGIVDPTKVVRCAIQNAASVAGTIITSRYYLVEVA